MDQKEAKHIVERIQKHSEILKKFGVAIAIIIAFFLLLKSPTNSNYINFYITAAVHTVEISVIAIAMGWVIGIVMGLGRISRNFIIRGIATVYIEILRGTPLLIQIFFIYFGLPTIGIDIGAFASGTLALGINSGAYQAEIIRGGIQSIPRGQMEAARSTGMSYLQAMRYVILPQGFRLILPPLTNEYVTVIKDSSLAYAIGVFELTYLGTKIVVTHFDPFTTFSFVALVYFTLTFSTATIMRFVERRFRIPGYMEGE